MYKKYVTKNNDPQISDKVKCPQECLRNKYFFPDFCKVSSVFLVFKNVGERYTVKDNHLLTAVIKIFQKLAINRLVDHLEKYGLFCDS